MNARRNARSIARTDASVQSTDGRTDGRTYVDPSSPTKDTSSSVTRARTYDELSVADYQAKVRQLQAERKAL